MGPAIPDLDVPDSAIPDPEILDPEILDPEILDPEILDPETPDPGRSFGCLRLFYGRYLLHLRKVSSVKNKLQQLLIRKCVYVYKRVVTFVGFAKVVKAV